ncbi:MAG TPA: DUF6338 family protein [Spirochaetota bacterium]|nr:MAG: hypothetical protein BWY96_02412 [Spirochaetes bacterium ADurb.BinA120]HPI13626.1 DUF6338 family protein [Spirochaetota bacterium]HPO44530.1 DUF6338 family protein [Spirochaetota bacterium]
MVTLQTLQILIFLIPGFISAAILNALIVRNEKKEFAHIVEALMFTMIIYTIYSLMDMRIPVIPGEDQSIEIEGVSFLVLLVLSVALPTVFAYALHNDVIMQAARKLKITKKTSRDSVWNDAFNEYTTWITIHFKDGSRITGYPRFFSDKMDQSCFYLQRPAWVTQKKGKDINVPLNVEGILITPQMPIEYIYFLKDE